MFSQENVCCDMWLLSKWRSGVKVRNGGEDVISNSKYLD